MADSDLPVPSVERDEISGLNLGSSLLFQYNNMERNPYLIELAGEMYGPDVTEDQIDDLDEQFHLCFQEFDDVELETEKIRRDFLVWACRASIDRRLELATQVQKEMEAYDRAAANVRNVASPKYVKAHKKKNTDTCGWERARAEMHDALISASKSLQELEKLCDRYEKLQVAALKPAYELMNEPYNLDYGRVEGFYAPEPDPIAPLMDLKIKGYDHNTRRQLARGFRLVKKYRSFMEDPKQKEMRAYAKSTEGETLPKTGDLGKVEERQGTAAPDSPTANLSGHVSPRSQAPSPPSRRVTPTEGLAGRPDRDEGTFADAVMTDAE